jgi:hypothetical protein
MPRHARQRCFSDVFMREAPEQAKEKRAPQGPPNVAFHRDEETLTLEGKSFDCSGGAGECEARNLHTVSWICSLGST